MGLGLKPSPPGHRVLYSAGERELGKVERLTMEQGQKEKPVRTQDRERPCVLMWGGRWSCLTQSTTLRAPYHTPAPSQRTWS